MRIEREGGLLVPAESAGISVPKDTANYSTNNYPHWHLYRAVQMNRDCKEGDEWHNAMIISKLPIATVQNATWPELKSLGIRGNR
jgi:hypothetical protein